MLMLRMDCVIGYCQGAGTEKFGGHGRKPIYAEIYVFSFPVFYSIEFPHNVSYTLD